MENLITLNDGHQVFLSFYQERLAYFQLILEKEGLKVISKSKPNHDFDYSYLIENFKELSKETFEFFGRANMKLNINQLSENMYIIQLKNINFKKC